MDPSGKNFAGNTAFTSSSRFESVLSNSSMTWLRLLLAFTAAVLALAGVLISPAMGEPDTARFIFGLWRWLMWGPSAGHIYDLSFSAGYYAFFASVAHGLALPLARVPMLLKLASAASYIALALLAFALGHAWLPARLAFLAALVWILTPGVWWLGIEAHPQAPALAWLLLSLWCWQRAANAAPAKVWPGLGPSGKATEQQLRRAMPISRKLRAAKPKLRPFWQLASLAALVIALLLRADAVLSFPAFAVMATFAGIENRQSVRHAVHTSALFARRAWQPLSSLALVGAASLIYLGVKQWLLGDLAHAQQHLLQKTAGYMLHGLRLMREPGYILKQLAPLALSPGPFIALLTFAGAMLLWRNRNEPPPASPGGNTTALLALLALWSLPQYLFWFLVLGNTARHVALPFLPVLWAGLEGWRRQFTRMAMRPQKNAFENHATKFAPDTAMASINPGWRRRLAALPEKFARRKPAPGFTSALLPLCLLLALAGLLDGFIPPPSADLNLFISANVPASALRLRRAERGLKRVALRLKSLLLAGRTLPPGAPAAMPCYLGTPGTDPYILTDLLLAGLHFKRAMPGTHLFSRLTLRGAPAASAPPSFRIYEVYGDWQYREILRSARPPCGPVLSVEYARSGAYHAYLGRASRVFAEAWLEVLHLHK